MAVSMEQRMWEALGELRFQPTLKRVRASLDGAVVADSTRAVLVWEPQRVVPSYAFPVADLAAELRPAAPAEAPPAHRPVGFGADGPPVLDPSVPFGVHTAPGEPLDLVADGRTAPGSAFLLADEDLADHAVLDFDAFAWLEEDEAIIGHPRDPFHRIDVRRSSRRVRIEHQGVVLAESSRCDVLFEGVFPLPRYYLPRGDVRVELQPSDLRTTCAYKGRATHHTAVVEGTTLPSIAWSYEDPLDDAEPVRSLVSFYQERLDLFVDGVAVPRVRTPWS